MTKNDEFLPIFLAYPSKISFFHFSLNFPVFSYFSNPSTSIQIFTWLREGLKTLPNPTCPFVVTSVEAWNILSNLFNVPASTSFLGRSQLMQRVSKLYMQFSGCLQLVLHFSIVLYLHPLALHRPKLREIKPTNNGNARHIDENIFLVVKFA